LRIFMTLPWLAQSVGWACGRALGPVGEGGGADSRVAPWLSSRGPSPTRLRKALVAFDGLYGCHSVDLYKQWCSFARNHLKLRRPPSTPVEVSWTVWELADVVEVLESWKITESAELFSWLREPLWPITAPRPTC
jgi:hypothetical protein